MLSTVQESTNLLDKIRVASPCSVKWSDMQKTVEARQRFCGQCQLSVYKIDEMTRTEAELFLNEHLKANSRPCIQIHRRHDGTILTKDCPQGLAIKLKQQAKQKMLFAKAAFASLLVMIFPNTSYFRSFQEQAVIEKNACRSSYESGISTYTNPIVIDPVNIDQP